MMDAENQIQVQKPKIKKMFSWSDDSSPTVPDE